MDNTNVGKDLINSALDEAPTRIGNAEESEKAYEYSEFCKAVRHIIDEHETAQNLKHGECHIAMDKLAKDDVANVTGDPDALGGVSVAVCGSISSMDKFHILDALMDALDMDTGERLAFFAANVSELRDKM